MSFGMIMGNQNMEKKQNLCYMDTVYIKIEDIYGDIAIGVEIRFDTSKYKLERPLPKRKNKKVVRLMKNELGGKIMTEFAAVAI